MYLMFIKRNRGRKELHNVRFTHVIYYIYVCVYTHTHTHTLIFILNSYFKGHLKNESRMGLDLTFSFLSLKIVY